ncbi:MAG TPA: hypothetical protein VFA55_00485 [Candidatus Kapabacteria bacterium]|nr:hypothetical protein [Candidatus Kapabacteria bacterium]
MMKTRIQSALWFMVLTACAFLGLNINTYAQTITYPAAGDVIKIQQGLKILVSSPPPGAVLWSNDTGQHWQSVASILSNVSSVAWNPFISSQVDSACYVAYATEGTGTPPTYDTSEKDGPFVLWTNQGVVFSVDYPDSANSTVHQDSTIQIKFSANNPTMYAPDTINLYIRYQQPPTGFNASDTLLKDAAADALRSGDTMSVSWKVPRTPTNQVRVFISTTDHRANGGSTSPITIKGASISVLSPKGGDTVYLGKVDTIRWSLSDSVSNDTVSIKYSADGGQTFATIARKVPSWQGYYVWNVQGVQPVLNNAEIVISADGGFVNQQSDAFSVIFINGVSETGNVPSVYIDQNYPNPFSATEDNSVTNIPFSLSSAQNISLRVFDVLGREIFRSPSAFFDAGAHTMQFNASQFLPGAYWYDLFAGSRSLDGARRMMLYVK